MPFTGTPGTAYSPMRNLLVTEGAICFGANVGVEPTGTTDPGKFVLYRFGGDLKIWDGSNRTTLMQTGGGINAPSEATAPSSPAVGDIYYDTTLNKLRGFQDSGWTAFDGSAAGSLDAAYNGGQAITIDGANPVDFQDAQTDGSTTVLLTKSGAVGGSNSASFMHLNSTGAHSTSGTVKILEISVGSETVSGAIYGIEIAMNADSDDSIRVTTGSMTLSDGDFTASALGRSSTSGWTATTANTSGDGFTFNIDSLTGGDGFIIDGDATGGAVNYFAVQEGGTNLFTITDDDIYTTKPFEIDVDSALAFQVTEAGNTLVFSIDTTNDAGDTTFVMTSTTTSGKGMNLTVSTDTGVGLEINADSVSTGDAFRISIASGTMGSTGAAISVIDSSNSDREIFAVRDTGEVFVYGVAEGTTAQEIGLGDFQITDGDLIVLAGEVAFTSTSTTAGLVMVNNTITTANSFVDFSSTSITTGAMLRINANTTAHDGEILELINAGDATSTAAGMSITMPDITTGAARGIDITMVGLTTTGFGIKLTMDAITTGDMLYLDNGGDTLTAGSGFFINCNDDDTSKFSVSKHGATTIAGTAAGTTSFTVSLGDVVVVDTDATTFTSVNGTGNMFLIDNAGGVIASGTAVLKLDAGGAVASGGNVLRIVTTGTPNSGAIVMEMDVQGDFQALKIDSDAAAVSAFLLTGAGAIADNKAMLEIVNTGTPGAAGSNLLRVEFTGTDTNAPVLVEIIGGGKNVTGLSVDADATTNSAVLFNSQGALAANKATLEVVSDVTTSDTDSAVLRVTQDHTGARSFVVNLKQDDFDVGFINFEGTSSADAASPISQNNTSGSTTDHIRVAINGAKFWIAGSTTDPT